MELPRLERAVRDGDAALRRLCVELSGKWRAPLCHRRRRDVPRTNNATERAIGRSKIRYKTVRGYKSEDGMLNGFGLTQRAWSGRDGLDVSELVAAQRRALGWGICVLRNPPQNAQPFLGRLLQIPPLDEQRRIVAILNERSAAARNLQSAARGGLDEVEAMPSALLRRALGDGG